MFLEVAGIARDASGMQPISGRRLMDNFQSAKSGRVNPARDHVLVGKEQHDVGRPYDWGDPIRAIFKDGWLYVRNYEPDRWPAGNPETGYLNCDGSPTKTECLKARTQPGMRYFWELSFSKRPYEELYHVVNDPDCLRDLANDPQHHLRKDELNTQMVNELCAQGDPRMGGGGELFEQYPPHEPWLCN